MIAILQPIIPHFRESFFVKLQKNNNIDIFCYDESNSINTELLKRSNIITKRVANISISVFLFYSLLPFLKKKYSVLVLMSHRGHVSTWLLLLTKCIHRKKIILWGHGISIKRFLIEEKKPDIFLRLMIALSDGIWLYTDKEKEQWCKLFPNKAIVSLNNTISDVEEIVNLDVSSDTSRLRAKYNITQEKVFLFCARFNNPHRRVDLLIDTIEALPPDTFAFVIIGDGKFKPDFSKYKNVFDYNSVYDREMKNDLFSLSDFYFQPGWVGLSIVEALAYGLPVVTFKRSSEVFQCVEYYYLVQEKNALIVESVQEIVSIMTSITNEKIDSLKLESKRYAIENLMMSNMVNRAQSVFELLKK